MKAITVTGAGLGVESMTLTVIDYPHAAENDALSVPRAGGRIVTIAGPAPRQPEDGQAVFIVVEPDRVRLAELDRRLQDGRVRPIVGAVRPLAESAAAFAPDRRVQGTTIITVPASDHLSDSDVRDGR